MNAVLFYSIIFYTQTLFASFLRAVATKLDKISKNTILVAFKKVYLLIFAIVTKNYMRTKTHTKKMAGELLFTHTKKRAPQQCRYIFSQKKQKYTTFMDDKNPKG